MSQKVGLATKDELTEILENGVILGYTKHRAEIYRALPQVIQCLKCQGFGHKFQTWKNDQKCLRCGGNHSHKECTKDRKEKNA